MRLDTLYKKRPYLFEIGEDSFSDSKEIIIKICEDARMNEPDEITFLASSYDYDIYRVEVFGKFYCIKYSFDKNNRTLKNEFESLCSINNGVVPEPYRCGVLQFGDPIHYLIVSYEHAENLKDSGAAPITEDIKSFIECFLKIQENKPAALNGFANYLSDFLKENCFGVFSNEDIEAIGLQSELSTLKRVATSIEKEIYLLSANVAVKGSSLCHGDLKPSNILFRDGVFKFIDFDHSFCGNPYLDLAQLCISIGAKEKLQMDILIEYKNAQGKTFVKEDWADYRSCFNIMIRVMFLKLLFSYLKEVYALSSQNPVRIFDMVQMFAKNDEEFSKIGPVRENHEFIHRCLLEPVIGRERV